MKVLFCVRQDYKSNFAGDTRIILLMEKYLKKLGVEVYINNGYIYDYSPYDIIHLFNLANMGETYKYYKIAHHYKKNIVLTPFYYDLTTYYKFKNDTENLKLWEKCKYYRKEILKGCRVIYPCSFMEAKIINHEFGNIPYKVIYNYFEDSYEDTPVYNFMERYNLDNYILCAARICHIKNQLSLVKVCNSLHLSLVLAGDYNDKNYLEECLQYKNVKYVGFLDNYNLYAAYKFAKVHVCPSFAEFPDISSIEAAGYGCNIIATTESCTKEYFDENSEYLYPYDLESIKEALLKAMKRKKDTKLKELTKVKLDPLTITKEIFNSYNNVLSGI